MSNTIKVLGPEDAFGIGPKQILLIGPPGTGKTRAALDSWVFPALHSGIDHRKIGVFSFSTAAASELRERVAKQFGMRPEELRELCSTIHSEALRRISATKKDWKLYDGVTREFQSLSGKRAPQKRIDENFGKPSSVRAAALGIWDYVRNVLRQDDFEFIKSVATKAKSSLTGVAASVNTLLGNIAAYEKEKRAEPGAIDFTDMLTEAANTVGRELDLLIVDEAQDCSPLQWKVIDRWAQRAKTVVLIGDPDQCHPAGTMITMEGGLHKRIEDVRPGDRVASVDGNGKPVGIRSNSGGALVSRVAKRKNSDSIISISNGKSEYSCTVNHRCVVRHKSGSGSKYAVYLARKGDRWRVGVAQYYFNGKSSSGVVARAKAEGADSAWVLELFDDRRDALTRERIVSMLYAIPQCVWNNTDADVDAIYTAVGKEMGVRARDCLKKHGRREELPFWSSDFIGTMIPQGKKRFTIYACNLIEGVHEVMNSDGVWRSCSLSRYEYPYDVFSLEVEDVSCKRRRRYANSRDWSVYFANDILTHNCIHEWAGASPEHFERHISQGYEVRKLAQSYRVPRAVHALARKIILRNDDRIDAEYQPRDLDGEVKKLSEKQILDLARETAKANDWPYTEEEEILAEMGDYDLPDPVPALFLLARDRRGCQRYANLLIDHGIPFIHERGSCLHTSPAKLAVALGVLELKRQGSIRHRNAKHLLEALPVRGKDFWLEPKVRVLEKMNRAKYTEEELKELGVDLSTLNETELLMAVHSTRMKITAHQAELILLMASVYGIDSLEMPPNIVVTTMHASKGREAETVVLSAQKPFPVQLTYNERKKKEIEAERRTLYVGATRARNTLIIDRTGDNLYGELK